MMALFASAKGKPPLPWDHEVTTDYTAPQKAKVITREGQFLRRIAWGQGIAIASLLVALGGLGLGWQLSTKIQEVTRLYVVEVNNPNAPPGSVRNVGTLSQAPYARADIGNELHVLIEWIWNMRTVGDSKVLQARAWENVLAFSDDSLHGWIAQQIVERRAIFQKRETVQIRNLEILPVDREVRSYRASWIEERIAQSGEVGKPHYWVASFTLAVQPPATLQNAKDLRNTMGIVVKKVNWFDQQSKGGQS
jgi:Type IV secretory pathway, TrbF components